MPSKDNKREKAREVVDILEEISMLLVGQPQNAKLMHAEQYFKDTELDRSQLSLCVSLIENGVNPEALATAIKELRREVESTGKTLQEVRPESSISE